MSKTTHPTLKVALQGEGYHGHSLRILNRFNNIAINHGGLKSLHVSKCDDKIELSATFDSPEHARGFDEALKRFLTKDKADHEPSAYNCKFTTLVI